MTHQTYRIRAATDEDMELLPAIEASAATLFRSDPDLAPMANDEPMATSPHREHLRAWKDTEISLGDATGTWVATSRHENATSGEIVGFVVTQPLLVQHSESAITQYVVHIKELSVHANHQRKGLASTLLEAVRKFASSLSAEHRVTGISLTTFRDVPYNGPFYARFGFVEVGVKEIEELVGDEATKIWNEEQEHFAVLGDGSLKKRRCWMMVRTSKDQLATP